MNIIVFTIGVFIISFLVQIISTFLLGFSESLGEAYRSFITLIVLISQFFVYCSAVAFIPICIFTLIKYMFF